MKEWPQSRLLPCEGSRCTRKWFVKTSFAETLVGERRRRAESKVRRKMERWVEARPRPAHRRHRRHHRHHCDHDDHHHHGLPIAVMRRNEAILEREWVWEICVNKDWLALLNHFRLICRFFAGWLFRYASISWFEVVTVSKTSASTNVFRSFTSFIATCGGRGWYRRHALPPAPKSNQHGQDDIDSEDSSENRTEEIWTSAIVDQISHFWKYLFSI